MISSLTLLPWSQGLLQCNRQSRRGRAAAVTEWAPGCTRRTAAHLGSTEGVGRWMCVEGVGELGCVRGRVYEELDDG